MSMQSYGLSPARIGKFKGEILKHAVPMELLTRYGRQVQFNKNQSDTYVARRWLPYNATATDQNSQNQFFQNSSADRAAALVQKNTIAEGVTPTPDSLTPVDVTVVLVQYGCLYGYTDKTAYLYEDDVPSEMKKQVGERVTLINELICWGALKAGTNVYYGGTGTSVATVNGGITLNLVRKIVQNLQANHAKMVNSSLAAAPKFDTSAIPSGFRVIGHTDMEPDFRNLTGFVPIEKYASGKPEQGEVGAVERFRFLTSPDLPSNQDSGAAIGTSGLYSTSGTDIDVYPLIVMGEDAWSQVAVRGLDALSPTILPPSLKSKSDPFGQRGYVGTSWWKAALIENNGWMAVAFLGRTAL